MEHRTGTTHLTISNHSSADAYLPEGKVFDEGKLSIGNVTDNQFPGTATGYLPVGDPDANRMYAYKVSRSCGNHELQCLQLSVPKGCTRLTLDSNTVLGLVFRMYVEPATKVGPAMPEILYDRIIKFSPRQ